MIASLTTRAFDAANEDEAPTAITAASAAGGSASFQPRQNLMLYLPLDVGQPDCESWGPYFFLGS
jgi:hypothetical protein